MEDLHGRKIIIEKQNVQYRQNWFTLPTMLERSP